MLVLSRKVGGRILIGKSIVVTVVAMRGGTVRIGVDAPRDHVVLRGEIEPARPAPVRGTSWPESGSEV